VGDRASGGPFVGQGLVALGMPISGLAIALLALVRVLIDLRAGVIGLLAFLSV